MTKTLFIACAQRLTLKFGPGMTALLSCFFAAGVANAQVIVSDPLLEGAQSASNVTQGTQLAKQVLQYEKQIQQYTTQLEQLRNMLTKIQSLGNGISLVPKTLEPLSDSQRDGLIQQACPGASLGGMASGVISGLLGNSNQSITERQQLICKEIVLIQVDEYNITAKALSELNTQASTIQQIDQIIKAIGTLGESSSAASEVQGYMAQLSYANGTWQKQIEADESMIATLQQQQGILAKVAFNGSNTVLGNLVQAAALKAAFTINE